MQEVQPKPPRPIEDIPLHVLNTAASRHDQEFRDRETELSTRIMMAVARATPDDVDPVRKFVLVQRIAVCFASGPDPQAIVDAVADERAKAKAKTKKSDEKSDTGSL